MVVLCAEEATPQPGGGDRAQMAALDRESPLRDVARQIVAAVSLLLLRANPLASTSAFDTIELVIVGGQVVPRSSLAVQ